jgi:hypothetical protein
MLMQVWSPGLVFSPFNGGASHAVNSSSLMFSDVFGILRQAAGHLGTTISGLPVQPGAE